MSIRRLFVAFLVGVVAVACEASVKVAQQATPLTDSVAVRTADSVARARQDSANRAQPGYVIDSLLPIEEEMRRFKAAVGGVPATALEHASPSRDALVASFVRAVEQNDTTALRLMLLTAREFIDLVYPESPYTRPPQREAPGFMWGQMERSNTTGFTRLLARRGGKSLPSAGLVCAPRQERYGKNVLWTGCEMRIREDGGKGEHRERLFGTIIERDGRFKFVSYANSY